MRAVRFAVLVLPLLAADAVAQPVLPPAISTETDDPRRRGSDDKPATAPRLRLGTSRFREASHISAASLSPDGKLVAVCGGSQTIRFLDVATGKEVRRITIREYLRTQQILWSGDGKRVITAGYNGVNVWDAANGNLVKQATNPIRDGRDGTIHVSADGTRAAVGHQYQNGNVKVVDLTTGSLVTSVNPVQDATIQGALSPKGDLLATWGQHYNRNNAKPEDHQRIVRTIQLWDAATGKEKQALVSDIYQVASVEFSPDGSKVAGGGNGVIQLWDVATGKLERRFAGRTGQGAHLVFSPDGKVLSAAGQDGSVQSWEVATGKRAGICEGPVAPVAGLRYRPGGQLLAWGINASALEIWEVPSGRRLTPAGGHTAPISALQFSADGKTLISCGTEGKILRWDVATGKELAPFELKESEAKKKMYGYPRHVGPSQFSPDGKYLVAPGSNGGAIAVWDVDAGLELFALAHAGGYVSQGGIIAFSADSTRLIAMNRYANRDGTLPIPIWDLETGLPLQPLKGQQGDFTCAGFSTDGRTLVTCAYAYHPQGGQIAAAWAWDLGTGRVVSKVALPNSQIQAVEFLDHRLYALFATNRPQGVSIYDAMTGGEVRSLEGSQNLQGSQALALSPDRRLLAYGGTGNVGHRPDGRPVTASRKVVVWEVASGSIRHEFGGVEGMITAVAFSRDGKTLAGGCSDTTISLWDLQEKPAAASPLAAAELNDLWATLSKSDGRAAEKALRTLAARPAEAVPFLTEQLKPVPAVPSDPQRIEKLITNLDAPRYVVREAAMRDLERLGHQARDPVYAALQKTTLTAEARERLEKLSIAVNKPDTGAEWLRPLRAVEALERVATPDAVAHLTALATGGDAPPTRAAREALERLGMK